MPHRVTIYALVDPRAPEVIKYVGQTIRPRERLRKHCRLPKRDRPTYRGHWLKALLDEGVQPMLIVLLKVQACRRNAAEREMIKRLRTAGHPLTNGSEGGDGGALRPEIQARVNQKLRAAGIRPPPLTQEQRAASNKLLRALKTGAGNPMKREDVRKKNAASQRARRALMGPVSRPHTPQQSANIAKAWAAKSGLALNGTPMSLLNAARSIGRHPRTVRQYAARHGLTIQQALDHYAKAFAIVA